MTGLGLRNADVVSLLDDGYPPILFLLLLLFFIPEVEKIWDDLNTA